MCEINWAVLLEYLKVLLSWPPVVLIIAIWFFKSFRESVKSFLERATEANFLGGTVKAAPPPDAQQDARLTEENPLARAAADAEAAQTADVHGTANQVAAVAHPAEPLPPELQGDPVAPGAIAYVRANPIPTVVQFKKLVRELDFERILNLIYGTQIDLMLNMASRPNDPVSVPEAAQFHTRHQLLAKRTEYRLQDYMEYLTGAGLISLEGPDDARRYRITQKGIEFLDYIRARYPSTWNYQPF